MKVRGRTGGRLTGGRLAAGRGGRGGRSRNSFFARSPSRKLTTNEEITKNTKNMEAMEINLNDTNERNFRYFQRNLPTVKPGTKGWENSETIEETILTLKKICAVSTNKKEQDYTLLQIQKYDQRCRELNEYISNEESRDGDEDEDEENEKSRIQIEMLLWDDVQFINEELKRYQIQASQEKIKAM